VKTILPYKTAQQTHKTGLLFRMFKLHYCTNFVQLILRKIINVVATRCHILRLKCTKFDFGWASAPDPAGGAHSAPPDLLTGFEGILLLSEGNRIGGKIRGKGREAEGREGEACVMSFGGWTPRHFTPSDTVRPI